MKALSKITFIGLAAIGVGIGTQANLLSISEKEINHYLETRLADKVKLQDKVGIPGLFQLNYHLYNLQTQIGQNNDQKVEITGTIDSVLVAKGKKYDIQLLLKMDTEPYYDAEQGAIYLRNVRLIDWQTNNEKYQTELQMFLPLLADGITSILNKSPVYTLDENKTKEALVKKFGKAIIVEQGALRLETKIF